MHWYLKLQIHKKNFQKKVLKYQFPQFFIPVNSSWKKLFKCSRSDDKFDYKSTNVPYKIDNIINQLMRKSIINTPDLFGNFKSLTKQIKDNVNQRIPDDKSVSVDLKFNKEEAICLSFLLIYELEIIEDRLLNEGIVSKIITFKSKYT